MFLLQANLQASIRTLGLNVLGYNRESDAGAESLSTARGKAGSLEMLRMKQPPGMCMKTKEAMTKCLAKNTPFTRKSTKYPRIDNNSPGFVAENAQVTR